MKVALVHDYLIQYGGAERVLEALMRMFPDAPIYTLLYDKKWTLRCFRGRVKGTAFLDWPFVRRNHRPFIPFMPLAAEFLRLDEPYDLVISDSAGFAKGVRCRGNAYHLSYCHTPLRYAWETDAYFSNRFFTACARPLFSYVRRWDYRAAQKPHQLLANSAYIAEKIKRYYGRDAAVVHPPVDLATFRYDARTRPDDYFITVGRLLPYKRFDLVIDAFRMLGLPLKVVGEGPLEQTLRERARGAPHIEFVPFVGDGDILRSLYARARAFIFPHVEDFGLVAAEALACGTPVIAFRGGGVLEIVEEPETGILFNEQNPEALMAAVGRFCAMRFDRARIGERAQRFGRERFEAEFMRHIPRDLH